MKSAKIFIFSGLILLATSGFGQLSLGIKGGFGLNQLTTDLEEVTQAAQAGYQFGAFVRLGDKVHLQPEIYFASKPGDLKYDLTSGNVRSSIHQEVVLKSVDVPLLVGAKIFNPPMMNIRLQAGPVASIVTKKTLDITMDGIDIPVDDSSLDSFKDMNWGIQFGAGVDVLMLTIDLRYELGLNNIYDQPDDAPEGDYSSLKNNMFFLSLGLKLL
ncbi:MAG: hypothetical protein Kow00127_05520 [Bacteroidales bacterium]